VLQIDAVHKSYESGSTPVPVLRGVSLQLASGESLAVIGPSGCGKSTLLHLIGTLDRPDAGQILLDGEEPHRLSEPEMARFRNRTIGFIFQDSHLLPHYTALENVLLPTLAFRDGRPAMRARAERLLDRVGLGPRVHHRPAELSGGERQRVAVARALVAAPRLLLCDEPTGSLDAEAAASVGSLLLELHAESGGMLVVVTHSVDLAARLGRRVELRNGQCQNV
jgi:ABC-type lipoprotein export system ATPase subunit